MTPRPATAIRHYWFGKAYRDMIAVIQDAHQRNLKTAQGYWARTGGPNEFLTWVKSMFFGCAAIMVVVFGTLVWLALVPVHVAIVGAAAGVVMLSFFGVALVENCYLLYKGWSTHCRHCGERVALPEFQCPKCGEWHFALRPSSYGILHHQCRCGEILACSFLTQRQRLVARCPHEHCQRALDAEIDMRSSTTVIPLIGPPNSGKTGLMIAVMKVVIDHVAPGCGLKPRFTDASSEHFFEDEKRYIESSGSTRKTANEKPPAFNVFVESPDGRIRHQIYLFDAAGEVFLTSDRMQSHYQFKHVTGGIFVIDPFSLPGVKRKYGDVLRNEGLEASITGEDAMDVLDRFLIGVQRHFGFRSDQLVKRPYAIVVTKTDLCELHREFEFPSIPADATIAQRRQMFSDHVKTKLIDWGAQALVHSLETRFAKHMFFAVAPIRLQKSSGSSRAELACSGVLEMMQWILETARDPMVNR